VVRSCLLIVMLVLTLLSGTAFGLGNALFLTSMSAALALILLLQRLPALIGDGRDASETLIDRRAWLHLSWPIFFVAVSQQLMAQSQVILLGWFSTTEQAGIYAIAVRISALVAFALAAVSTVSGPSVAAAYERDDYAELRRLAYLSARLCFAAAVAVIAVLVIFGHQILLLFGDEFAGAYPAMLILLLGGAVNAFTGTVGHFLAMTGRQITLLWIMLGTAFLSITLALLLIPSMGSVGAAWASVSGLVLSNIAMVIAVRRELGIDSTAFGLPLAPGAKYLD
jgi:O-antigen/teichoic acid export membrane protein